MHLVFAGRMALLVTLFLVLVNIFNSVTANAPKSEGLTAVETWVVMCILHVFCVLLEYAIILKIIQVEKRKVTTRLLKLDRANNALSASNTSLNNKSLIFSADRANRFHIVWKSPKMYHLKFFSILAFSTNFCPIKIDLSGNTVWLQVSAFQKLAKIDYFWHFYWTFVHSKSFSVIFKHCDLRLHF